MDRSRGPYTIGKTGLTAGAVSIPKWLHMIGVVLTDTLEVVLTAIAGGGLLNASCVLVMILFDTIRMGDYKSQTW